MSEAFGPLSDKKEILGGAPPISVLAGGFYFAAMRTCFVAGGALTLVAEFAAQAAGSAHSLTAAVSGVFGSGTPQVTAFVLTVLALDTAVGMGIALVYFVVRPRLAARLASVRESS